jgi:alkylated DNA repair dioxygenase AlkB
MAATETLPLDHITTQGTQARAALSDTIIHEYAEALARGDTFPPIEVYFDETTYWLADGFHRVNAARIAGHTTIAAVVHAGGTREALLHAISANEEHGYRRTDADRRHAVSLLLADAEWREWNNSAIARQCRVSEFLVRTLRRAHEPPHATPESPVRTKKVQRGGTTYPMRTGRIGSATASKTPPVVARTATAGAETQEGIDTAPPSSIASKTVTPSAPALYVHQEETPAGPSVPPQTEDESHPASAPPWPHLIDAWQQATDDERKVFIAMYCDDLRTLLAAHDEQSKTRVSTLRNARPSHGSPDALNRPAVIQLANGGELTYIPGFFPDRVADEMFAELRDGIPWEQIKIRGHLEPRMTKWFGEFAYRYSGVTRPAVPWDEVPQAVQSVQSAVEREVFGTSTDRFNGVLLNYYRSGDDKIGWHADDEKDILRDSPIASVSFGAERRFILKHNQTGERREITLAHGSLLVMAGTTQRFWKHCVPVERRIKQGRINLTFRRYSRGAA